MEPGSLASPTITVPSPAAAPTETQPPVPVVPCPVQESVKIVGRKWHLIILWELSKARLGFNELKAAARGISAKMLAQSLAEMESQGLVLREIVSERPLRVSYRLTAKAEELAGLFDILDDWGRRHGLLSAADGA